VPSIEQLHYVQSSTVQTHHEQGQAARGVDRTATQRVVKYSTDARRVSAGSACRRSHSYTTVSQVQYGTYVERGEVARAVACVRGSACRRLSHVSDRPSTRLRADGVGAHDLRRRKGTHSVVDRPWHKITEDERRGRRSAKEGAERRRVGDATLTSPQRSGAAAKSVGKSLTSPQRRGTEEQHGGASGGGGGGGGATARR
jgi:hypothetical protein